MSDKRKYETICIFASDAGEAEQTKIDDKIKKIFTLHKVEEVKRNNWGNKKLAYPIQKYTTGNYVQFVYELDDKSLITDLEKNLGYEEKVLRFMTTLYAEPHELPEGSIPSRF